MVYLLCKPGIKGNICSSAFYKIPKSQIELFSGDVWLNLFKTIVLL